MANGKGDILARGGVRAQFNPAVGISQDKWDSIFEDFDAEEYRNSGNAHDASTGDAGTGSGKSRKSKKAQ